MSIFLNNQFERQSGFDLLFLVGGIVANVGGSKEKEGRIPEELFGVTEEEKGGRRMVQWRMKITRTCWVKNNLLKALNSLPLSKFLDVDVNLRDQKNFFLFGNSSRILRRFDLVGLDFFCGCWWILKI